MKLYTIGFTKKSARQFFTILQQNGVLRLVDIRLHPDGQLSGFAKADDLAYFLPRLAGGCEYYHLTSLSPTDEVLADYRKDHDWNRYVQRFENLMDTRGIPEGLDREFFTVKACCLLCSEATPEQCHRRLVAERLARCWPELEVVHL
jgi:uncharacterized protein (DUF488 family)